MQNFSKNSLFKRVSILIINSFLLLDIAWAGVMGATANSEMSCLSPSLIVNNFFLKNSFINNQSLGGINCNQRKEVFEKFLFQGDPPFQYEKDLIAQKWHYVRTVLEGKALPPFEVEIQPETLCNVKCRWCIGREHRPKHHNFISRNMMRKIIDDIADFEIDGYRTQRIRFSGFHGETLINPSTLEGMERALERGMEVGLFTNGLLLTKKVRKIVAKITYIHVSLDSGSKESFSFLKKTGQKPFEIIISNIQELVRLKKKIGSNVMVNVGFILQPENYKEIPIIATRLKKIGINNLRFKVDIKSNEGRLNKAQAKEAFALIESARKECNGDGFTIARIHLNDDAEKLQKSLIPKHDKCLYYNFSAAVGPDGSLYPCDHRAYPGGGSFGSIMEETFEEIWTGVRKKNIMRLIKPHKHCEVCPPYGNRMNEFLGYMASEQVNDPYFLDWIEMNYVLPWMREDALEHIKHRDFKKASNIYITISKMLEKFDPKESKINNEYAALWNEVTDRLGKLKPDNVVVIDEKKDFIASGNIFVTGGTGFIGRNLVETLFEEFPNKKIIVIGTRRKSADKISLPKYEKNFYFEHLDLRDSQKVQEVFEKYRPEIVFHMASKVDTRPEISIGAREDIYAVNLGGTVNVLKAMEKTANKVRIIFASSTRVYGMKTENFLASREFLIDEEQLPEPVFDYDISKLIEEELISKSAHENKIEYSIARLANVIPRFDIVDNKFQPRDVLSVLTKRIFQGDAVEWYGDAENNKYNFVHVSDVTDLLVKLALSQKSTNEIFNVGSGQRVSLEELRNIVQSFLAKEALIKHAEGSGSKTNVSGGAIFNIEKVRDILDFTPQDMNVVFKNAIESVLDSMSNQGNGGVDDPPDLRTMVKPRKFQWEKFENKIIQVSI